MSLEFPFRFEGKIFAQVLRCCENCGAARSNATAMTCAHCQTRLPFPVPLPMQVLGDQPKARLPLALPGLVLVWLGFHLKRLAERIAR